MKFAVFFQKSVTTPYRLIEGSGDRSVIILDGRERNVSHSSIARDECVKRGYLAYQLWQGETFTRASAYSPIVSID